MTNGARCVPTEPGIFVHGVRHHTQADAEADRDQFDGKTMEGVT